MNPSKLLRRFLENGTRPSSQREASALLDESRSLLVSKLPTTDQTIQNFSDAEIEKITSSKSGMLERSHRIYLAKQDKPSARPTAKTLAPKPTATAPKPKPAPAAPTPKPRAIAPKPIAAPVNPLADATDRYVIQSAIHRSSPEADRIAARAELERRGINISPEGIRTESSRGGRAVRIANLKK